jgi:hypothetical protein
MADIDWDRVYALLNDVTPLKTDCGKLCGAFCCQEYEPGVGVYLEPGEESRFEGEKSWCRVDGHSPRHLDFCPEWESKVQFVGFLRCLQSCPREKRPLHCRTFPLAPYLDKEGKLTMVVDNEARMICPLARRGETAMTPEFREAALKAWQLVVESPLHRAQVEWLSRKRDERRPEPWERLLE